MTYSGDVIFKGGILPTDLRVNGSIYDERRLLIYGFLRNQKSILTTKAYKFELTLFYKTMKSLFPDSHEYDFTDVHFIAMVEYYRKNDRKDRTISRHLSALTSFYDYLIYKRKVTINPLSRIKRPRQPDGVSTPSLTQEELSTILRFSETLTGNKLRWGVLIQLFFTTGLRHIEITSIRKRDIRFIGQSAHVSVTQKGNNLKTVVLSNELSDKFRIYLSNVNYDKDNFVFGVKNLNRPPSASSISFIFKKISLLSGINFERFRPHVARATVVTILLINGQPIEEVADHVNHKDIRTTNKYKKKLFTDKRSIDFQELLLEYSRM